MILQVLLQHSRMIHHVSSPILFSPAWRKVFLKLKAHVGDTDEGSADTEVDETLGVTKKQNRLSGNFRKSGDFSGRKFDISRFKIIFGFQFHLVYKSLLGYHP